MNTLTPSPRTIRRVLDVLQALSAPALALLTERLIDRMDALEASSTDLEPDDDDCCPAGDDDPASSIPRQGVRGMQWGGDPLDDEPDDDAERDGPAVFGPARCRPVRLARAA